MRPFLKWAGGKYRLLDRIKQRLPDGRRLLEPFAGSAAVFLNTAYQENVVADLNQDLIRLYTVLQQSGGSFIDDCQTLFTPTNNSADVYYELRDEFNRSADGYRKSMLFLYLNRHGFNGLCRYNRQGGFNVPFGRYKQPYFPRTEMFAFAKRSADAQFVCADFLSVMRKAESGDVIYCDPPYVPLSATAHFSDYSAAGFGPEEQRQLALVANEVALRGVPILVSNHCNAVTLQLYQGAKLEVFDVQRLISCDGENRGMAKELLALFSN